MRGGAGEAGHAPRGVRGVLEREPPSVVAANEAVPPALERVIRRCLAKDSTERWQCAADLGKVLRDLGAEAASEAGDVRSPARTRASTRFAWGLAAAAAVVAVVALGTLFLGRGEVASGARGRTTTAIVPAGEVLMAFERGAALSPDGRWLAYQALSPQGRTRVWVQSLESGGARVLEGTDGGSFPFWSPDNRWIGFFARGNLRKIPREGGPVQTLARIGWTLPMAGPWSRDGVILVHGQRSATILRIPDAGGEPAEVTTLDQSRGDARHWVPSFLPDGRHFLFVVRGRMAGCIPNGSLTDASCSTWPWMGA